MKCRGDRAGAVLAVGGLAAEARIAAGPQVRALAGGGDGGALGLAIEREIDAGARALISFGIAGALDRSLAAGTLIVARCVRTMGSAPLPTDVRWSDALSRALPHATRADVAGSDTIVATLGDKSAWHAATGAAAVDMESHIVGTIAARHGLPFVVLRAIADPADRPVPHAATVAMRPGGGLDLAAVLGSLARSPAQLAGLCRLALDSRRALRALLLGRRRLRDVLGDRLGHADLDQLLLDVV